MTSHPSRSFLTVTPFDNLGVLKGLASPVRMRILALLHQSGLMNVQDIGAALCLPQSTVASNVLLLEEAGLITSETVKGRRGQQKLCGARYEEIMVRFRGEPPRQSADVLEVSMPLGLYTNWETAAPCGLCSTKGIIGPLDVPEAFVDPGRMEAALIWFGRGYVEYRFPNNARLLERGLSRLELVLELASEAPGSSRNWPSDITVWVNDVAIGTWTAPVDHGGVRGKLTPAWWKTESSQFGDLKTWAVDKTGSFIDQQRVSTLTLAALNLPKHRSIRVRIGIDADARHPGGVNIFGRGFGNFDQDILMRLHPKT